MKSEHPLTTLAWPLVIAISAALAMLAINTPPSPFRTLAIFWFLLVCPGMAFLRMLRIQDRFMELMLGIGLSIALDVVVSETLVMLRLWQPVQALAILVIISLLGGALQIISAIRAWMSASHFAPRT